MIQVIRASPRQKKPTFIQQLSRGVGEGLETASKLYSEHQKEKAQEEQYKQENDTYSQLTGRNLSKNPKIREKEIEYALKGESESQKEGRKYKSKAEEQASKLAGEQKTQGELISFADRLEGRDPKFKGIADIYRLDIPLDQKTKIVQSITGSDVYREDQQKRLMLDSTLKKYSIKLKELDEQIKSIRYPTSRDKEEYTDLIKQRMALRNERDQILDFRSLSGYEDEDELGKDEESISEDEEESGPTVKFDANNPKHKAVAEKLYKKYGDKEKVREILRKNFKGL